MTDIIATVDDGATTSVVVATQEPLVISSTNLSNPAGSLQSISDIGNVDTTTNGTQNGSILVYKTTTNMWTSTTTLDAQHMEGGEF